MILHDSPIYWDGGLEGDCSTMCFRRGLGVARHMAANLCTVCQHSIESNHPVIDCHGPQERFLILDRSCCFYRCFSLTRKRETFMFDTSQF